MLILPPIVPSSQLKAQWNILERLLNGVQIQYSKECDRSIRISDSTLELLRNDMDSGPDVGESDMDIDKNVPSDYLDLDNLEKFYGFEHCYMPIKGKIYKENIYRLNKAGYEVHEHVLQSDFRPMVPIVVSIISWA